MKKYGGREKPCTCFLDGGRSWCCAAALAEVQLVTYYGRAVGISRE